MEKLLVKWAPASQLLTQLFIQDADQRKHQGSASLAFVRGIHRSPMNSPHKGPATGKMIPFDDVIMCSMHARFPCLLWSCLSSTRASLACQGRVPQFCLPKMWLLARGKEKIIIRILR